MTTAECRAQLRIGLYGEPQLRSPWAVPHGTELRIGRDERSALHIPETWVPHALARFLPGPTSDTWLLQNGSRARLRVQDAFVDVHEFGPRAMIVLQSGSTQVSWPELDDECRIGITIASGAAAGLEPLDEARTTSPIDREARVPTEFAADDFDLTPGQRVTLAVLFAHLILGTPKPANLAAAAGAALGRSASAVTVQAASVRARLNKDRWLELVDTEQLGHYLVNTARALTLADLPTGYVDRIPSTHRNGGVSS